MKPPKKIKKSLFSFSFGKFGDFLQQNGKYYDNFFFKNSNLVKFPPIKKTL